MNKELSEVHVRNKLGLRNLRALHNVTLTGPKVMPYDFTHVFKLRDIKQNGMDCEERMGNYCLIHSFSALKDESF